MTAAMIAHGRATMDYNIDNEKGGDDYFSEPSDVEDSVYPTGGDYYTSDTGDSAAALKPMVPRAAATHRPPRAVALSTPVPPNQATQAKQVKRQAGARGSGSQAKPVKRPGNYHGGSAHATPGHHNGKPSPSAHVAANQHAVARAAKHSTLVAPTGQGQAQGQGAGGASGSGGGSFSSSGGGLVATPGAGSGGSGGTGGTGSGGSTGSTGSGSGTGSGGAVSSPDPAAGDASYDDDDGAAGDGDADDVTPDDPPADGVPIPPVLPPTTPPTTPPPTTAPPSTPPPSTPPTTPPPITTPPTTPPPTTTPPTTPPPSTTPPTTPPPTTTPHHLRCGVAPGSLLNALNWACGPGGADCSSIQPGGACFQPGNLALHASVAFNSIFHSHAHRPGSCFFGGNAVVVPHVPDYAAGPATCTFPSSNGQFCVAACQEIPDPYSPPQGLVNPVYPQYSPEPDYPPRGVVAPGGGGGGRGGCAADMGAVQRALDWACGPGGVDCSPILPGGACWQGNGALAAHASHAFTAYFYRHNHQPGTCFFGGTAVVVPRVPDYAAGPPSCTWPSDNGQYCVVGC
ncbi:unnamed protein product [Closterium sp. Yama58-4]|nr:unnamed protein product [Closterium sp. Yama58-4]